MLIEAVPTPFPAPLLENLCSTLVWVLILTVQLELPPKEIPTTSRLRKGRTATKEMLPMQPGDVPATYADIDDLARDIGFKPATTIEDGIERFGNWYREYHKV